MTSGNTHRIRGYAPAAQAWTTGLADPDHAVPDLAGTLTADPAALDRASRDLGRLVTRRPGAVLHPASVADVEAMVAFCAARGIAVSARGEAHTTDGQGLTDGLVITTGPLNRLVGLDLDAGVVDVEAGAQWIDLVRALATQGLRVACALTGYLRLTLGGTLSVGGIGADYGRGCQVGGVRGLEVVTPAHGRLWCSETEHPDLFDAALAGLGQVGVITRFRIAVEPAPATARVFQLDYPDAEGFFRDAGLVLDRDEFDEVFCMVHPAAVAGGAPVYQLNATRFTAPGEAAVEDAVLLRGLAVAPTSAMTTSYLEQAEAATHMIDGVRAREDWDDRAKPWFDVFLPDEAVRAFVEPVVGALSREEFDGPPTSFVLLHPQRTATVTRPLLRVPESDSGWFWLFDVLTVWPGDADFAARMRERNRALEAAAEPVGGLLYQIGTSDRSPEKWARHYGPQWERVVAAKDRYDPRRIMTRGAGVHPVPVEDADRARSAR
ncbi:FAD-binding protein [Umezawaea sp.]|uniref:FAD-binding protein n=1 Tax=Umezawaea sp. TaxID=1955258 RepID=UPI002ED0D6DE